MGTNNNKSNLPNIGGNRIKELWSEKNIYDNHKLDMSGMPLDKKNFVTIHHIFGKGDNNKGFAVIGRLLHDYIDNYLLPNDTDEYIKWNNYFARLYKYSIYSTSKYNKGKLIRLCNDLLFNIVKNDSEKAKKYIDKLRPYLNERLSRSIVEAFISTKFNEDDFIPSKILRKNKVVLKEYNNRLKINKEDTSKVVARYFKRKLKSYFLTKENHVDLLYKIFPEDIEELDSKYKIGLRNIKNKSYEYIKPLIVPKHDWMGSIAYPEEISQSDFFLTKTNMEILDYLFVNNPNRYNIWMDIFNKYKNGNINPNRLLNKTLKLRKSTLDYIYEVLFQPHNLEVKNTILKNFNLMSESERREAYCEVDTKFQLAIAYVFHFNNEHRMKMKEKTKKLKLNMLTKSSIKLIDKDHIHTENITFPIKNDEMGNDFDRNLKGEERPKDKNFLSKDSLHTLNLLKQNPDLHKKWVNYLNYISSIRELDHGFFNKDNRRYILNKVYRKLYTLREETRKYFQERMEKTKCDSEIKTCLYMVNLYRKKDINFWIRYQSNEFNSEYSIFKCKDHQSSKKEQKERLKKELDEKTAYYNSFKLTNDSYSTYIKDTYDRKFLPSFGEEDKNELNINRTKEFHTLLASKCNKDSLGLYIGTLTEEEMNISELIGFDIFITESSYNILKYLKENEPNLFTRWVELLKKKVSNDVFEEEYSDEQLEILIETSRILKRKYKSFDRMLKTATIKVGKTVGNMKRTRK